jgi:hypothetical protein
MILHSLAKLAWNSKDRGTCVDAEVYLEFNGIEYFAYKMFPMDRRLVRKPQYSMLCVPTARQYPLHDVLYKQVTPKAKLPTKGCLRRRTTMLNLGSDSGDEKDVCSPIRSYQRYSTTPHSSSKLVPKVNFSEYIRLTLNRRREENVKQESKEAGEKLSYNDLVYSTILRQTKKNKARKANYSESSTTLEPKIPHSTVCEKQTPSATFQPIQLPVVHYIISSSSLPTEKLVRRVVNLPKSPFGVHKDFGFDLTSQYVSPERSSTWLNINNSKRTAPRRRRNKD